MRFFAYLATLTSFVVFPAWSDLFEALTTFTIPPHLFSVKKPNEDNEDQAAGHF